MGLLTWLGQRARNGARVSALPSSTTARAQIADRIRGREQGSHAALMAADGAYARLAALQFTA